jgi:hypothetical protein
MTTLSCATECQVLERVAAVLQIKAQIMHPRVALSDKADKVALATAA